MPVALLCLALTAFGVQTPKWTKFDVGGGITVEVPAKPVLGESPGGKDDKMWMVTTENDVLVISSTVGAASKNATSDETLGNFIGDYVDGAGGTLTEESNFLLKGYLGVSLKVKSKDGQTLALRVVSIGARTVSVTAASVGSDTPSPIGSRFLASMRLPSTIAAGPLKEPLFSSYPLGDSGLVAVFPKSPVRHDSRIGRGEYAGPLVQFHTLYINQFYSVAYRTLTPNLKVALGDVGTFLQFANDDTVKSLHGTSPQTRKIKVGEFEGIRTTCSLGRDGCAITQAWVCDQKVLVTLAVVPKCMKQSPEVEAFLSSLGPAKPSKQSPPARSESAPATD